MVGFGFVILFLGMGGIMISPSLGVVIEVRVGVIFKLKVGLVAKDLVMMIRGIIVLLDMTVDDFDVLFLDHVAVVNILNEELS